MTLESDINFYIKAGGKGNLIEKLNVIKKSKAITLHAFAASIANGRYIYKPTEEGKAFACFPYVVIGVHDYRPRQGTYLTPFDAEANDPFYLAPDWKHTNDRFEDLVDQRASMIINNARRLNKKIRVFWSGGIDSTLVLSAFIKNLQPGDREMIQVCMNTSSVFENMHFYLSHVQNKFEVVNSATEGMSPDILSKYLVIHGDPADALFGPSTPIYMDWIKENTHHEPWKKHMDKMASQLNDRSKKANLPSEHTGTYFVRKMCDNIISCGLQDDVSTVADFWWWTYINFKWRFSCTRQFFYYRNKHTGGIPIEAQKEFAENCFFNWHPFQLWSYSNKRHLITQDMRDHKRHARKYIYELDNNKTYMHNKRKISTQSPAFISGKGGVWNLMHDHAWKPIQSNVITMQEYNQYQNLMVDLVCKFQEYQ